MAKGCKTSLQDIAKIVGLLRGTDLDAESIATRMSVNTFTVKRINKRFGVRKHLSHTRWITVDGLVDRGITGGGLDELPRGKSYK